MFFVCTPFITQIFIFFSKAVYETSRKKCITDFLQVTTRFFVLQYCYANLEWYQFERYADKKLNLIGN